MKMPWPANRLAYAALRRALRAYGRRSGRLTRIAFGSVEIEAPLAHPAVYWRYRPVGANLNYLRLAKAVCAARKGVIVDVGANIGDGVALLRGNGVDRKIVAIEGSEEFVDLLRRNVAHLDDVDVLLSLLSDTDAGNLSLNVSDGTGQLVASSAASSMTTLDALSAEHGFADVALLKTDTDGFDAKVVAGARKILSAAGPVVFSEVDDTFLKTNGDSAHGFFAMLAELGYETVAAWDNNGRWLGHRSIAQGVSDWIARYPGGDNTPYIDAAAFKAADRTLAETFFASEKRLAAGSSTMIRSS